jgi:hypothetical protein
VEAYAEMTPRDECWDGVALECIYEGMFGKGERFDVLIQVNTGCDGV